MKGSDLKCECGAGAVDVAPDYEFNAGPFKSMSHSWHCSNGHLNITGMRPGFVGIQQQRFDAPKMMGVVDELDEETAAVPLSTEGARHVPAAELREREVLAANHARTAEDEPELLGMMGGPIAQARRLAVAGDVYLESAEDPTLSGLLESMGVKHTIDRPIVSEREQRGNEIEQREQDALNDERAARFAHVDEDGDGFGEEPCPAATRVKRNNFNHTIRCQKPAGHNGGHEAKADTRTTIWYGEAQKLPGNERYRFGLNPHWLMEVPGRKTMAGDFDNDE